MSAPATGDESGATDNCALGIVEGVPSAIEVLGRDDEIRALVQEVGEGERGAAAVPGVKVVLVEVVPGCLLLFGGGAGGGKCVAEDVEVCGVWGGHGSLDVKRGMETRVLLK